MQNKKSIIILIILLLIANCYLGFSIINLKKNSHIINFNEINLSGFSTDLTKVVEKVASSIVTIRSEKGLLSGFVYTQKDDKTYVVTSYHGLENSENIQVLFANDISIVANIKAYDTTSDICLLELSLPYNIKGLEIGDASYLSKGEFAIVLGTPISLEFANSPSLALIADKHRQIDTTKMINGISKNYYEDLIQINASLNPGNSGGALVNMDGQLIGMIIKDLNLKGAEGISFALSSNEIELIIDAMIAGNNYQKHHFGIKGSTIKSLENYQKSALNIPFEIVSGYYVNYVKNNQIASKAEILKGDIILKVNGEKINDEYSLMKSQYSENDEFVFEVYRNGEILELKGYHHD